MANADAQTCCKAEFKWPDTKFYKQPEENEDRQQIKLLDFGSEFG